MEGVDEAFGSIALALVFRGVRLHRPRRRARRGRRRPRPGPRRPLVHARRRQRRASTPRFDAQARFVRYRSFDAASVPTILGFADFDGVPLDGCKVSDGTAELDSALAADSVGADRRGRAARRRQPRAARSRRSRGHLAAPLSRAGPVRQRRGLRRRRDRRRSRSASASPTQVSGEGGNEVGPFNATVTAPRSFPTLQCRRAAPRLRPRRALVDRVDADDASRSCSRRKLDLARRHAHRPLPRPRRRRLQHSARRLRRPAGDVRALDCHGDGDPPCARALLRPRRRPRRAHPRAQGRGRAPGQPMSSR